jgi:pyruvate formate-lyase/glycerol dehydratase family glycyl radical enzyme
MFEFASISDRIQRLRDRREWFNSGHMKVNTERTEIYTDYYRTHGNEYPILKRSGCLFEWCAKKKVFVDDDDIFVGTLGPETRTANYYMEWSPVWLQEAVNDSDENFSAAWQQPGEVYMSDEQREIFRDAFEFWKDKTIAANMQGIAPDGVNSLVGDLVTFAGGTIGQMSPLPAGHYIANFKKAINVGFGSVRKEAQAKLDAMEGKLFDASARSNAFYRAVIRVCDGAVLLSRRYAAACREKAGTAEDVRKAELLRMADSLDWIMENPARTYWEALQTIIFYQILLCTDGQQHGQSMGRIDRHTGHLLQTELDAGTLTIQEAQDYTDAFILRVSDFIVSLNGPSNETLIEMHKQGKNLFHTYGAGMTATGGIHLTLGGMLPDGSDGTTAATPLFLQSSGRLYLPDPTLTLRIHKGTPDFIWKLAIESSKRAGGLPQFENDESIIPLLLKRGMSLEDARNYGIVGCIEPGGNGNEWTCAGNNGTEAMMSLTGCVIHAINGGIIPGSSARGVPCKKLYEYESFDEFKEAFVAQVHHFIGWEVSLCSLYEQVYSEQFPCIAASTLLDGCMEKGLDATWGGAKHNSTGMTIVGIGNVADCLMSIKKLCFDDKSVPLREMYDALANNWEGYEDLRQTVINEVPHYGNADAEVDALADWAMRVCTDYIDTCSGPRGNYTVGTFSMSMNVFYGDVTPATPDGRRAGEPLADAISPRQGFDRNGPTAYLRSASRLPHSEMGNGNQLNIKFSPASVQGEGGDEKLMSLFRTYFDMGGMQVQFNVVSTEQLYDAQKHPDDYKDLIVRIAGYSAYFVEMPRALQDDFISRTEQAM